MTAMLLSNPSCCGPQALSLLGQTKTSHHYTKVEESCEYPVVCSIACYFSITALSDCLSRFYIENGCTVCWLFYPLSSQYFFLFGIYSCGSGWINSIDSFVPHMLSISYLGVKIRHKSLASSNHRKAQSAMTTELWPCLYKWRAARGGCHAISSDHSGSTREHNPWLSSSRPVDIIA